MQFSYEKRIAYSWGILKNVGPRNKNIKITAARKALVAN